jgi:uncharacterized membrane protein
MGQRRRRLVAIGLEEQQQQQDVSIGLQVLVNIFEE